MSPAQAAALLTIAAAYDNRKPDADAARAWAMVLGDLGFEDCRDVVVDHYRTSREWLMPADVVAGVRALRKDRLSKFGPFEVPSGLSPEEYTRFLHDTQRRIADGELKPGDPVIPHATEAIERPADIPAIEAPDPEREQHRRNAREAYEQARWEKKAAEPVRCSCGLTALANGTPGVDCPVHPDPEAESA